MRSDIYITHWKSPYGELLLADYDDRLCMCDWLYRKMRTTIDRRIQSFLSAEFVDNTTPIIIETIKQLNEYFSGERKEFNIPLMLVGSDFQRLVWEELMKIPYGKTSTYMELSKKVSDEKAIRAVASANGANAISIIIPCHRVIGSDGKLTGYAGGLKTKSKLLDLENPHRNPQLDLFKNN